ncbi:maleylpyruvate isomerase family mycothiol-dependent enzyme [Nocardia panacis]|uniref:Maleylpyruvate isomerase family mycothiol-dependent enzyme n=1 Tax=Nocardia panacis TaxID=2340916 RepID=A0A3A4KFY8_9NOCA|nr:maleylpyruvate isomerase family mycothiol-dependent enzyme [Nocardia panacis]RJO79819.1 maleylpyruvate isomerase family mycothiol-dependent enzyme [Nocardia panacis]
MVDLDAVAALATEYERVDRLLARMTPAQWESPSAAAGWTVSDTVLHLAQTDELVTASVAGEMGSAWLAGGSTDDAVARLVEAERGAPSTEVFERWRRASTAALASLRSAPPGARLTWVRVPLSAPTLAATRLAEHWAHLLDIADPLGLPYPDTDRLWLIARLAHRTLPYAFAVAQVEGGPVRCELIAPSGATWTFGPPETESVITGAAGEFCRVGAHRLRPADTALQTTDDRAATALRVLRNYAA